MADNEHQTIDQKDASANTLQPSPKITSNKPHSRKKRLTLIASAVVPLLILVILGIFLYLKSQDKSSHPAVQVSTSQKDEKIKSDASSLTQPEEVIKKVEDKFATKYTVLDMVDNNQPKVGEMSLQIAKSSPPYKVSGYDFYTNYDGGSSLNATPGPAYTGYETLPRPIDVENREEIANIYKGFGLSKVEERGDETNGSGVHVYMGAGLICTSSSPNSASSGVYANCGLLEAYISAAKRTKPFADAFPNKDDSTGFLGLTIKDSTVSGYQKAYINMMSVKYAGGAGALFYKKGSEAWTYFKSAQQALPCSFYDTDDLRNAFKGDSCGEDGKV